MNLKTEPINKLHGVSWQNDELGQKFSGAWYYGALVEKTKTTEAPGQVTETLFYIVHGQYDDSGTFGCMVQKPDSDKNIFLPYPRVLIAEERPPACIANIGEFEAIQFAYNPARQWRRGVGHNNSFVWYGGGNPYRPKGLHWDSQLAQAIFFPTCCKSLKEALAAFDNKSVTSRAFSTKMWLHRTPKTKEIKLYARSAWIGTFIGSGMFMINPKAKIYLPELEAEISDWKSVCQSRTK